MPLLKGLAATAAMSLVLYGGHALLVTADESKLMLVVKCGLTGVAGCAVYLGVSLLLRQTIMAETCLLYTSSRPRGGGWSPPPPCPSFSCE